MYTRILVPLDGSPRAEHSVPVAAMLARATHGSVVLVRVLGVIGLFGPIEPTFYNTAVLTEERREATAYLTSIAGRPALSGIPTETGVFTGSPAVAILDAITAYKADGIVITSHGRTGIPRWALGSVAEHIIRHVQVPVIVLRETGSSPAESLPDREHQPRVLVTLDGSPLAEAALEPAVQMAKALGAPRSGALHLALVVSPYEAAEARMDEDMAIAAAKEYLTEVAAKVRARHESVAVTWSVAINVDVASGVIRVAEKGNDAGDTGTFGGCDVIAMATHGRAGLKRWMVGSVTERVLHATTLPMLIVRPGPVEANEQANKHVEISDPASSDIPAWSALF